jgi:heme-degrading monooxygenase HmoA
MHVRITWGRVKPESWDEYEAVYQRAVPDDDGSVPGLRGRMLLRDVDDPDTGGTLSLWDSAESARAYEAGDLRREVLPQLEPFFTGEFISHVCEVRSARGDLKRAQDA